MKIGSDGKATIYHVSGKTRQAWPVDGREAVAIDKGWSFEPHPGQAEVPVAPMPGKVLPVSTHSLAKGMPVPLTVPSANAPFSVEGGPLPGKEKAERRPAQIRPGN